MNILKLVYGWQNDGYQKGLFYGINENSAYPAGCGEIETRQHYIRCQAHDLRAGYNQHRLLLKQVHGKLHTAQVIYRALIDIIQTVREGKTPVLVLHLKSDIADTVRVT